MPGDQVPEKKKKSRARFNNKISFNISLVVDLVGHAKPFTLQCQYYNYWFRVVFNYSDFQSETLTTTSRLIRFGQILPI